ncbi:hypothetical protein A3H38_01120 [candidate division WOR-1 bacterium RIFCSPLOWO2_02_FULL_46_20]|uniref:UDP-3-O-[3-hydroxymyristoyl] glucosamine N-acyltransferase non-repeat region domain-containing protein n=2 Tax=Saganbacteria TaxID=1703751 RepID=A0A1F4RGD4_UNCSA|nr:MAG: hypothetical protein A3J44_01880 [candidate division WOR-1 bacterium RIFCSPHIGHO2_02_FULL_45_12]OGC06523.1 MAG: hypothetical protein A3H38_01120 [candidate division WOR-1 bacterium RIFCSPLOWO2_02_FULL_46_20]OGC09478.1 MAG: hypothetical protein A3F86_02540 [candidate division WOR-1 bacterium RIFCSPLOWO2_12_FULL_45_9]
MKLKELAKLVSGKVVGNGDVIIRGAAPIDEANRRDIVFVLNEKFLSSAIESKAAALVASTNDKVRSKSAILVGNPRLAMAQILAQFAPRGFFFPGIHKTAIVPKSCKIGKGVTIGPYTVLEEKVIIGAGSIIYPQVYIGRETRIGKNCIIHSGARVGTDGFGYVQQAGKHIKIPQIGIVLIEDNVEIYANVCVARATLGATIIGQGTKIDNLSHVAHNCKIGKDCAVVSLVGFAGSVTLKDRVYVAGQVGFKGHTTIGEDSIVMARAGVSKDFPARSILSGFPAQDHRKEMALQASLRRLAKKANPGP